MKKILLLLVSMPMMVFGMTRNAWQQAAAMGDKGLLPPATSKTQASVPNVEKVDKFLTMEQKHMTDWLNYKQAKYDAKIEMMKKHLNQIIDLKRKGLAQLNAGMDLKTYMADGINKYVSLHEAQTKEWREFHEAQHKQAKSIDASHKNELTSFKGTLAPMTPAAK